MHVSLEGEQVDAGSLGAEKLIMRTLYAVAYPAGQDLDPALSTA